MQAVFLHGDGGGVVDAEFLVAGFLAEAHSQWVLVVNG